jgi:hypothetical protein
MGRPTREQAALSAMLAEQRNLEIKEIIEEMCLSWRACPATAHLHPDFRKVCDECTGVVCARMRAKGMAEDGSPLARKDRPCCSAKSRSGVACKKKVIPGKTKCRYHGGLSTGPKTEAGKARIAAAQRLRWQRFKLRND